MSFPLCCLPAPAQAGRQRGSKMGKMANASEHAPLGQLAERYWVESRRPLASLVFIAPLLIVYEVGVLLLGVQNGADAFMRRLLDLLGFGQHFLLPRPDGVHPAGLALPVARSRGSSPAASSRPWPSSRCCWASVCG